MDARFAAMKKIHLFEERWLSGPQHRWRGGKQHGGPAGDRVHGVCFRKGTASLPSDSSSMGLWG